MADRENNQESSSFSWPRYPESESEFEALMHAVDKTLANDGVKPFQRPIHAGRKFWEAFQWGGQACPPRDLASQPGFTGDVLMAKAHRWYEQSYGEKLKIDMALGFVPVLLGNAVWRMKVVGFFGSIHFYIDPNLQNQGTPIGSRGVPASFNVLCAVEDLPQGLADRLPEKVLVEYIQFYMFALNNMQWCEELHGTELFSMAKADYDQSTADVLAHRYGQARWGAQQAVEKTVKGLLSLANSPFPTGGSKGHDLKHLAGLLKAEHGVELLPELLELASCSAGVRYGEEASSEGQAYSANHAVLGVWHQLSGNQEISNLLASVRQGAR